MRSSQAESRKIYMTSKTTDNSVSNPHVPDVTKQPRYETPRIISYTEEEILQDIGPAQGYRGQIAGVDYTL